MREMKDSGNKWIGDIPADWSCGKTIYYLSMPMTDGPHTTPQLYDDGVPFVSAEAVSCGRGKIDFDHIRGYISEEFYEECCKKYIPQMDDIYMIKSGATTGRVSIVDTDVKFTIWSPLAVYRVNKSLVMPKFMFYAIQSPSYMKQVEDGWNYGTQQNIGMRTLEKLKVAVPPYAEQKRIVEYLDTKWNEIDALAADIQSQIDTLEQYKRSVITEAVTKGLDRDAEMKESGIEYVGKIPASWDMHPVYYYFGERKHKNSLGEEQNLLSLSYGNIIRKDINTREGLLPESFNTYNIVEAGDIIIRPTDLQNDKRSLRTGLVREHGIITSAYIDLMPVRNINTEYYHYLLHAFDVMKVFYNMGNGVRQGLNFAEFSRLMVFEPSLAEQNSIVDYLNDKCGQINTVISEKQDQLATLDAYKKSTIYEYVTGKKEVPAV